MSNPPWTERSLSTSELITWLGQNADKIKHLTAVFTQTDNSIDVRSSVYHRECASPFREMSAHSQALTHATWLSTHVKDRAIQP